MITILIISIVLIVYLITNVIITTKIYHVIKEEEILFKLYYHSEQDIKERNAQNIKSIIMCLLFGCILFIIAHYQKPNNQ